MFEKNGEYMLSAFQSLFAMSLVGFRRYADYSVNTLSIEEKAELAMEQVTAVFEEILCYLTPEGKQEVLSCYIDEGFQKILKGESVINYN